MGRAAIVWFGFAWLALLTAGCNTPMPAVFTEAAAGGGATDPEAAVQAILPTRTASVTPLPTATPVPAYLSVRPEDLDGLKIHVWHGFRDQVQAVFDAFVDAFNDENAFGIVVSADSMISDVNLSDRVLGGGEDGGHPNLIFSTADYFRFWSGEGVLFAPLDDYFAHPQYGLSPERIRAIDARIPVPGKRTVFPLWYTPYFLFYNDTWGQQLGFSGPPETFEAFAEQSCAAYQARMDDEDRENNGTGGWIISSAPGTAVSWLSAFEAGKIDFSDLSAAAPGEAFLKAVSALRKLFDDGCVWQSRLSEPYAYFADHEALFYSGTAADLPFQRIAFAESETNGADDWRLIPYPGIYGVRNEVFAETFSVGIVVQSAVEQFASWLFLSYVLDKARLSDWAGAAMGIPIGDETGLPSDARKKLDRKLAAALYDGAEPTAYEFPANWITIRPVLADGFAFAFAPGATIDSAPVIWEQVLQTILEISQLRT